MEKRFGYRWALIAFFLALIVLPTNAKAFDIDAEGRIEMPSFDVDADGRIERP